MTKAEMLTEMLNGVKWSDNHKKDFINKCKATKGRIEAVYEFWKKHPDKSYFCIGIL